MHLREPVKTAFSEAARVQSAASQPATANRCSGGRGAAPSCGGKPKDALSKAGGGQ
eukprot:XP_001693880.1 predicted protein [Chlamydomonas reinhardtii]